MPLNDRGIPDYPHPIPKEKKTPKTTTIYQILAIRLQLPMKKKHHINNN
jgi:hypothetical protein